MPWPTYLGNRAFGAVRIGDNASLLDGELITIGGTIYEWDNNAAVTGGHIAVTIAATAALSIDNLIEAINDNQPDPMITAEVDLVDTAVARLVADAPGSLSNLAFTTTMADADNIIAPTGGLLVGGENSIRVSFSKGRYTVTALDVAAGSLEIQTGILAGFSTFHAQVRTSLGVEKAVTSKLTIGTLAQKERILLDFDGATNPVAGDVIDWVVFE